MKFPDLLSNSFFKEQNVLKIKKDKTILFMNEIPQKAYLIVSGTVRVYSVDKNANKRIISYIGKGDILPGAFVLGLSKVVLYFYEAASDVECIEFGIKDIKKELLHNHDLSLAMLQSYALSYYSSLVRIESLAQNKAQDKILKLLRYLILKFGVETKKGWMTIDIKLKQNDIAEMTGITRETIVVELATLKKQGIIDYKSFKYSINLLALGDMVDSALWASYRD